MRVYSEARVRKMPNAIIFDLDNTLYAYGPAHRAAMDAVIGKAVALLSISQDNFRQAFSQSRDRVKKVLGTTAASHSRLLYFQRTLEDMGLGSQPLVSLDFEQTYWRTFLNHAALFEGAAKLLDAFRLLGVPMSMVTDLTAQIQFRKVLHFGLDRWFDSIVTSEEIGHDKPHADLFKVALDKMSPNGDIVWMIGDDADKDIRGAKEAVGAITLQKLHKGVVPGEGPSLPDAVFYEYGELVRLLDGLGGGAVEGCGK